MSAVTHACCELLSVTSPPAGGRVDIENQRKSLRCAVLQLVYLLLMMVCTLKTRVRIRHQRICDRSSVIATTVLRYLYLMGILSRNCYDNSEDSEDRTGCLALINKQKCTSSDPGGSVRRGRRGVYK